MIDIVQAALDADFANSSETFNKFLESESVISLIKGENSAQLRREMYRLHFSRKLQLLSSVIARTDLTKDSTLKDFVSNHICLLF